jgi:RNA polymerase sigma-70 factor (ECF subfamily)
MAVSDVLRDRALSAIAGRPAVGEGDALVRMDEGSFRAFYDRTARGVWVYLARLTGDRQQADDLLQETYFRFYKAGSAHESESHRRNSLYLIATNLARDAHRRRHNIQSVVLDENELPVSRSAAEESDAGSDLRKAMERLKPAQRELLWLAYIQGYSHAEIAETLGTKVGSVKQLLLRARRKLARLLRGEAR